LSICALNVGSAGLGGTKAITGTFAMGDADEYAIFAFLKRSISS
jgi:hypothetical protein